MRHLLGVTSCLAIVLSGCATSPKTFYADPTKPNDTELCRVALDAAQDAQFRFDVGNELMRRGLTPESCQAKINTQNAAVALIAIAAGTTAIVAACNNGSCPSGGGGSYSSAASLPAYSVPPGLDFDCAGGSGDGPRYIQGPFRLIGPDYHDLDRNHNGVACESWES